MEAVVSEVLESRARRRWPAWVVAVSQAAWAAVKLAVGILLTMSPVGAVVVVGWLSRFMQRTAFKVWWNHTERPYKKLMTFREAAAHRPGWAEHESWPNWVLGVRRRAAGGAGGAGLLKRVFSRLGGGLWDNLRLGAALLVNTYLVLGLPCLLMATWWYAGWQVSFNKAYEYFSLGALFSLLGVLLFVAGMFYVPMAQARQAVAGEWRAFWQFSLVRRVIRRRWFGCLLLAAGYALAGLWVLLVLAFPMAPQVQDWFGTVPPEKLDATIRGYYLIGAAGVFPLLVALRWAAARLYASGMAQMLAVGQVRPEELSPSERHAFPAELINGPAAAAEWSRRDAVLSWMVSAPFRLTCGTLAALTWFAFVTEIYVAQFFVYRGPRVWLSHPLVQLPWTDYTPSSRAEPK